MSNIANSLPSKVIAIFVGIMTAVMMFGVSALPTANAAALTQVQITSILDLLTAFGADQSVIDNVNASLTGGTPTTAPPTTGGTGYTFTRNLTLGDTGEDVRQLQIALNREAVTQVASSGVGSPGNETSFFGNLTKTAVTAFQNHYASEVLTPLGLSAGTGFFGPSSRTKLNALNATSGGGPGDPPPVVVTGSLSATLSPTSPAQGVVISGQGIANLAEFLLTNGANAAVSPTKITLMTAFISNDISYSNVYLYNGGTRLTDSASVTDKTITFNDSAGLFSIPAGTSMVVSVRVDIAATATGQVMGVALTGIEASVSVVGAFPITAAPMSVAAATLAAVDFNATTQPSTASDVEPNNDVRLWQNTVSVSTTEVDLTAMSFRNVGSVLPADIINFDLYVDGVIVASVPAMTDGRFVNFDFTNSPVRLDTGSAIIKLEGDIIGGASRTYDFEIRTTGDAVFIDSELGAAVVPTVASASFSAVSGATQTIAGSTGGSVTVSKANNSPLDNVSTGASSVLLASFEFRASGERMKVESLDVNVTTSGATGLDNGKVFVNGSQVGSTKDLTEVTDINFTFGSSFIIEPGDTAIVDIYADTKSTGAADLADASTIAITLGAGSSNAQGKSSLQTSNVPAANTVANTITVASATATVSKFTGYGNQTRPAGTNNLRLGSFVISAGSTEGADVNSITIDLSTAEAATLTNMRLVDNSNGGQLGVTKNSPSTSNSYSVNITIPKSGTMVVDIMADVLSGADAGTLIAEFGDLSGNGATTGTSISVTTNVTLQTITIGSGTLTLAVAPGDPNSDNIIAGASAFKVGEFRFSAANSDFTVNELAVKVATDAATSIGTLSLRYQNEAGTTIVTPVRAFTGTPSGAQTHATATFTGLSMFIPADDDATVEVLVDTITIPSGASTGKAINVSIDWNEEFKAVDSAGTQSTTVGTADVTSGGTFYLRESIPTITRTTLTTTPVTGLPIYEFTIAADAAGSVEFKELSFTVTTNSANVTSLYLREKGENTNLNDSDVVGNLTVSIIMGAQSAALDNDVISIAAGSSKTFQLFGTVTNYGGTGDSIVISFTEDTSFLTSATSEGITGNIIWSDRSAASHTTITADWTNGFLLDDLSSDVQSYSS